jgi:divalent metal cation (Fe/Co/Zn/Cd) transporter
MRNDESHQLSLSDASTHTEDAHGHTHGAIDPVLLTAQRGMWAVKWSFLGLAATALLQVLIVGLTGSVALLADTIHNLGDALTAILLWVAFRLSQWKPNRQFTYGYGRVESKVRIGFISILSLLAM